MAHAVLVQVAVADPLNCMPDRAAAADGIHLKPTVQVSSTAQQPDAVQMTASELGQT